MTDLAHINVPRLIGWLSATSEMATQARSHTYALRMAEAVQLIREADNAHRAGYELARAEALACGLQLRAYDEVMK